MIIKLSRTTRRSNKDESPATQISNRDKPDEYDSNCNDSKSISRRYSYDANARATGLPNNMKYNSMFIAGIDDHIHVESKVVEILI